MILPNPSMDFTPFDVLTAAELDDLVENDQAIATGLNDGTALTSIRKNNLTIDSNPYKFRARRVAAQNSGNGVFAIINFDTEDFDTNNNFDITTNVGRYTVPISGFYSICARASMSISSQGLIALYKNGSILLRGGHELGSGTGGVTLSTLIQLTAGDYLEVYSFASGGALETSAGAYPEFSGFLVSRT